jgi:hypothetical protein
MSPVTVVRPVPASVNEQPTPQKTVRPPASFPVAGAGATSGPNTLSPQPAAAFTRTVNADLAYLQAQSERRTQMLWRARALRYVLIYLLMASALVTLRYQTHEVYTNLRDNLRPTRTELQRQRSELSLRVQTLTSEQRVRAWALGSGMVPYAQAAKQTQVFGPTLIPTTLPAPASLPTLAPLSVKVAWK